MRKTRLALVSTLSRAIKAFLLPYARHFRGNGWEVHAIGAGVSLDSEIVGEFNSAHDIPWTRSPQDIRNILTGLHRIRGIILREAYDVIHVHTPVAAFIARLAVGTMEVRSRPAVVDTAHGFHFHSGGAWLSNRVFVTLEQLASRFTDVLVVMNQEDLENSKSLLGALGKRTVYLPGVGIDLTHYDRRVVSLAAVENIRKSINLPPGGVLFSIVAEFTRNKNHQLALRALSRLTRSDVHLACAGEGPELVNCKRLARDLGIERRVHFLGHLEDIMPLLVNSLATVLPSIREGFPRCILESLSLGVPVIGSNVRGTRDVVSSSVGILTSADDSRDLAEGMERALREGKAWFNRIKNARQILSLSSQKQVLKAHEVIYELALERVKQRKAR